MDLLQVCWVLSALCGAVIALPPQPRVAVRKFAKTGPARIVYAVRPQRSPSMYALVPPPETKFHQPAESPTFALTQDQYLSALQSLSAAKQPAGSADAAKSPAYYSAAAQQQYTVLLPTPQPVHEEQAEPGDEALLAANHALAGNHKPVYPNHLDEHVEYAAKYQFGYHVRDPKHGSFFGHSEARDGHSTKGQYHVLLPDGRLQNVQYWADPSGYHAQVSYDGVARHYQ